MGMPNFFLIEYCTQHTRQFSKLKVNSDLPGQIVLLLVDPTTASDKEKTKTKIRKRFSKYCQDLKDGEKQSILPSGQIFHQIKHL